MWRGKGGRRKRGEKGRVRGGEEIRRRPDKFFVYTARMHRIV